jgi:uncharacterized RDD family membrane protein YckC
VIETCKVCGAVNEEHAESCCFCDARLPRAEGALGRGGRSAPVRGSLAVQPDWRREVSNRLKAYRSRQARPDTDDSQSPLPFDPSAAGASGETPAASEPIEDRDYVISTPGAADPDPLRPDGERWPQSRPPRCNRVERVEITVHQSELDFASTEASQNRPSAALHPVAGLGERQRAGLLDAAFLLVAYAGLLGLFKSLGGHLSFGKFDLLVCAATLTLFYAQYFALFTALGGSTPGMVLCHLRVVSFDGSAPTPRQLLWRSFGYLISVGTALLGFLWALWDEDHLTWQDRISQTYLTHCPEHVREEESPRAAV